MRSADRSIASDGLSLLLLRPLANVVERIGGDSARFMSDLGVDETTPDDA